MLGYHSKQNQQDCEAIEVLHGRLGATLLNTTKQPQLNSNDTFVFLVLQLALINACL